MKLRNIFKILIMMRCSLWGVIVLIYLIKYFIDSTYKTVIIWNCFSLQLEGVKGLIIYGCKHSIQIRVLNLFSPHK